MRFGVVVFPGSNCDHDCYHVLKHVMQQEVRFLWHKDRTLPALDAVVLPGGFSYGDYLRTGAIARFSPLMEEVVRFANSGGLVIGICNGFQILCEAGLLPGALVKNRELHFVSKHVYVRIVNNGSSFTHGARKHILRLPIAHGDGSYFAREDELQILIANHQVLLQYCSASGEMEEGANPNGSLANIAGIMNAAGNVMGLMPHPERAAEALLGSTDGLEIFRSVVNANPHPRRTRGS